MDHKLLRLQPRLQLLADLVPEGARLADVGTDHGYLPVWLLQQKRITSAVASDVGAEPLEHARRTARAYGVDEIDFRLCDGLAGIEPESVDTIVIAGMGADTMIHILEEAPWTKEGHFLLLQPMTKPELLRRWLVSNGYHIEGERLVWDKAYLYPVLRVTGGVQEPLTTAQEYGCVGAADDPLYGTYLAQRIERLEKAIRGLRRAEDRESEEKARRLETIRQALVREKGDEV